MRYNRAKRGRFDRKNPELDVTLSLGELNYRVKESPGVLYSTVLISYKIIITLESRFPNKDCVRSSAFLWNSHLEF